MRKAYEGFTWPVYRFIYDILYGQYVDGYIQSEAKIIGRYIECDVCSEQSKVVALLSQSVTEELLKVKALCNNCGVQNKTLIGFCNHCSEKGNFTQLTDDGWRCIMCLSLD